MQTLVARYPGCCSRAATGPCTPATAITAAAPLQPRYCRLLRRSERGVGVRGLQATAFQSEGKAEPAARTRTLPAASGGRVLTSNWPCKGRELVKVVQQGGKGQAHQIRIVLEHGPASGNKLPPGSTVELHWGVYRSSPHLWQHPTELVPPGSTRDERSGAMCSAMQASLDGGSHSIALAVPPSLAPLTLAFVVCVTPPGDRAARRRFVTPLQGRHFSALIGTAPGSSEQQGATLAESSAALPAGAASPAYGNAVLGASGAAAHRRHTVNFAVRCRGAERVCLVLLRPQLGGAEWGMLEVALDPSLNRTGELWHVAVEGLPDLEGLCYGWRLEGDEGWESGSRLQPYQLLLDPYCPSLRYFPAEPAAAASPVPLPTVTLPDGSLRAALSSLEGLAQQGGAAAAAAAAAAADEATLVGGPGLPLEDLRLLELDVRTFAQGKGVQHPGSFLGVAERVGHIRAVGANAVVLTPSYASAKGIGLMARAAVHYRAADPLLASSALASSVAAAAEFRRMVSALHAAGIEVLLMVDLTFTAEGTDAAPHTLSLRGLDHSSFYRANGVLNCGQPATQQYLLDVLRHWAGEGVDGFCFINAENLVQDRHGTVLDAPPLVEALCHDPRLCALKMVALPSDDNLLPRSGARGFPHWGLWLQRNLGFGADVMAYLAEGAPGMLTAVAGRLTGSAALFDANWNAGLPGNLAIGRRPAFSVNTVTVLGRQSLAELAAEAAQVAAAAAGAAAAGGYAGAQGAPSPATVAKSLLALTVLASGAPVVPQDAVADLADAHFVGVLMRQRRRLAHLLLPPRFDSPRDIRWHGADAAAEPIWDADLAADAAAAGRADVNYLAFSVRGSDGQGVYVGINPHPYPVTASLPRPAVGRVWERIVDTSLPAPEDALLEGGEPISGGSYQLASKAVLVLQSAVVESLGLAPAAQQTYAPPPQQQQTYARQPVAPTTPKLTPQQMQLRQLLLQQQQERQEQGRQ